MRWRTLKKQKHPNKTSIAAVSYAPFAARALGFITDIFMIGLPITLVMIVFFGYGETHTASGMDILTHNEEALRHPPNPYSSLTHVVLFMSVCVVLWHRDGQTPGKKMARIRVVDAKTFQNAPYWKLILRFVGYFISAISLVGFFIGNLRQDKRALHDLLSGTAVIREEA